MKQWVKDVLWLPIIGACTWFISTGLSLRSQFLYTLSVIVLCFGLIMVSKGINKIRKRYYSKWVRSTLTFLALLSMIVINNRVSHSIELIILPALIVVLSLIDMVFPMKPKGADTK